LKGLLAQAETVESKATANSVFVVLFIIFSCE
jgi:hypothetical protein